MRFVKIKFSAPVFDKVTKDRAAKFVDQLSAIGGTMGLLTGFSIISAVGWRLSTLHSKLHWFLSTISEKIC